MSGRRSLRRGQAATVLRLVGVPVLLALAAGPALVPPVAGAADSAICVGVVTDSRALQPSDGASRPDATCVSVPPGSTGNQVLAARARQLGTPAPTYRSDGLVCSIDGYPRTGCQDVQDGGGYHYWAYYVRKPGAAGWTYANYGPGDAHSKPADGAVEGWAFQNGGAEGQTRPPLVDFETICGRPAASPTSAGPATPGAATTGAGSTTPATAPDAPAPTGATAAGPTGTTASPARAAAVSARAAPTPARSLRSTHGAPAPTASPPAAARPPHSPGQPPRTAIPSSPVSAATATPGVPGAATSPAASPAAPVATAGPAPAEGAAPVSPGTVRAEDGTQVLVGAPAAASRPLPRRGRGALGGLVLGGVAILGLAGAAGVVARRRRGGA